MLFIGTLKIVNAREISKISKNLDNSQCLVQFDKYSYTFIRKSQLKFSLAINNLIF